jgi:hypothetical protein
VHELLLVHHFYSKEQPLDLYVSLENQFLMAQLLLVH